MKAKQEIRVGLDALRTRVAAHRQRRVAAALAQRRHPTNRAGKAHPEPLRRRTAAHAFLANRRNHPLAQIHRQGPHPAPPPIRRTPESHFQRVGNTARFNPAGNRSSTHNDSVALCRAVKDDSMPYRAMVHVDQ